MFCEIINWISFFEGPSAFSLEEKAGKKKGTSAPAAVFQVPLQPKKQTWFFFLELVRVKKKEPKKKPLQRKLQKKKRWLLNYWTKLLIADWNGKGQALRVWSNSQPHYDFAQCKVGNLTCTLDLIQSAQCWYAQ